MPQQTYQPFQPPGYGQQPDSNALGQQQQSPLPGRTDSSASQGSELAIEMIRAKLQDLYTEEPNAKQELTEAEHHTHPGSKHQQFMNSLHASGKSMAEIQVAWHEYYTSLPDHEKHEVWQEFYSQSGVSRAQLQPQPTTPTQASTYEEPARPAVAGHSQPIISTVQAPIADRFAQALAKGEAQANTHSAAADTSPTQHSTGSQAARAAHHRVTRRKRTMDRRHAKQAHKASQIGEPAADIKKKIVDTVKTAAGHSRAPHKLTRKHHFQSALFGLGCGAVVLFIFLFGFFNQVIIAPFIQPSRNSNNTPVIVDTASAVIGGGTKIIIPKINLEIPVDYSVTTASNAAVETALDNGVVHYPSTTKPGEIGNAAFFGHSSNNIFNPGKYKFAFVLLHELEEGDVFYLNYGDKTYAYRIFRKHIVTPKQVEVLQPIAGKTATATLITCDPPGTSINRLVVVGEQISPDPNTNGQPSVESAVTNEGSASTVGSGNLPGNGQSLWSRIINSVF